MVLDVLDLTNNGEEQMVAVMVVEVDEAQTYANHSEERRRWRGIEVR